MHMSPDHLGKHQWKDNPDRWITHILQPVCVANHSMHENIQFSLLIIVHTLNSECVQLDKDWYLALAIFLWSQPQDVAALVNFVNSGWHIAIMRLIEGEASSVCDTLLKFDAVILPLLILYHNEDFDWDRVLLSTAWAWSDVTVILHCLANLNSSP